MTRQIIEKWKDDLASEKDFISVIYVSWRDVGSKNDLYASVVLFSICAMASVFCALVVPYRLNAPLAAALAVQWSTIGLSFASSVLGFIIAGFSIFATMTDRRLFHTLAKIKKDGRSVSEFKFVFYNFLYVFFHYIIYTLICLSVVILLSKGAPIWRIARDNYPSIFIDFSSVLACCAISTYTIHIVFVLKTFIWNLYQSILFAIFHDAPA
jgi:hypothetical protein